MSYKKRQPYTKPTTFLVFALIGLVLLVISGINLFKNNLILVDTNSETIVSITEPGDYYIMVDTNGVRYETELETIGVTQKLKVYDDEDSKIFETSLLAKGENDSSASDIIGLEFDKQIRHKEYLGFAKITLEKDDYRFNSIIITDNSEIGGYALLSQNYVNKIGLFSLSAVITLLFGLLSFKYYREVQKIPMSKYQKKHIRG